jgi:hypothetical protein
VNFPTCAIFQFPKFSLNSQPCANLFGIREPKMICLCHCRGKVTLLLMLWLLLIASFRIDAAVQSHSTSLCFSISVCINFWDALRHADVKRAAQANKINNSTYQNAIWRSGPSTFPCETPHTRSIKSAFEFQSVMSWRLSYLNICPCCFQVYIKGGDPTWIATQLVR